MNKCSTYDYIQFENGILDNIVDAVYVMLLKNSSRTNNVYKQIYDLQLSKNNFIQINEKYTDCEIDLCEQKSYYHMYYNLVNIFKHSIKKKFKNILVLEDDFIFDEEIKNKNVINDLENFINNNTFDIYGLGNPPMLIYPNINLKHIRYKFIGLAHSIIFSKDSRLKIIDDYKKNKCMNTINGKIKYHDIYFNYLFDKKYTYYKPLCFQPLTETENQLTWINKPELWFKINKLFFSLIEIDKKPKLGLQRMYIMFYIINLIVYIIIIYVLYKLINYLR